MILALVAVCALLAGCGENPANCDIVGTGGKATLVKSGSSDLKISALTCESVAVTLDTTDVLVVKKAKCMNGKTSTKDTEVKSLIDGLCKKHSDLKALVSKYLRENKGQQSPELCNAVVNAHKKAGKKQIDEAIVKEQISQFLNSPANSNRDSINEACKVVKADHSVHLKLDKEKKALVIEKLFCRGSQVSSSNSSLASFKISAKKCVSDTSTDSDESVVSELNRVCREVRVQIVQEKINNKTSDENLRKAIFDKIEHKEKINDEKAIDKIIDEMVKRPSKLEKRILPILFQNGLKNKCDFVMGEVLKRCKRLTEKNKKITDERLKSFAIQAIQKKDKLVQRKKQLTDKIENSVKKMKLSLSEAKKFCRITPGKIVFQKLNKSDQRKFYSLLERIHKVETSIKELMHDVVKVNPYKKRLSSKWDRRLTRLERLTDRIKKDKQDLQTIVGSA